MFSTKRTYLDYAAGGSGNPSSPHEEGRQAKNTMEKARTAMARLVEVKPDDVVFTKGATEANALAVLGCARALYKSDRSNIHVLYLPSAHASIVENVKLLRTEGVVIEALPIKDYRVDEKMLTKMLRNETALVFMDAVCGETGVVWNTREVRHVLDLAREAHPRKSHILLHVDASQAPLTEKISRAHFGADLITFDAAKVGAARGIGALIAHRTIPITTLYQGGGQERGLVPGTEAPDLAESFAQALREAVLGRAEFRTRAEHERVKLVETIMTTIPNVCIQEGQVQAPHILNLSLPGRDTDYLVALLDEAGFAVSTRSACETDSETGSRAVLALTGDRERARTTLRISWGPGVHSREFTRFAKALTQAVAFLDIKTSR